MGLHLRRKLPFYYVGILICICLTYLIDGRTESFCQQQDDQHCNINLNLQRQTRDVVMMKNLPRVEPIKVGHTRNIQIVSGKMHQMRTLSMNPPVFEVENFLTDNECDVIIGLAQHHGLQASTTVRKIKNRVSREKVMDLFYKNDLDGDGTLEKYEIGEMFIKLAGLMFVDDEVEQMSEQLELDTDGDGRISEMELYNGLEGERYDKFFTYLENLQTVHPERKVRYSDTVFIKPSSSRDLFETLRYRIANLTGLPYGMIKAGEDLQVVRYRPSGHYHSHLDSEESSKSNECCQYRSWRAGCRLCRYLTVLYFLNDVEEGGETAFPIADNATADSTILFGQGRHVLDLGRHCHDANMYYKPKKRTALLWYNHKLNPETGWMGDVDLRSLHGGCDVIKGSKWIANNWIDASRDSSHDINMFVKSLFDKSL